MFTMCLECTLNMVKLKEGKLKWALKQRDKKNEHLAYICGVNVRRFQQLKADYRKTGEIPKLNWNRRPKQSSLNRINS